MIQIPTNVIVYMLAGIATFIVGVRATMQYRKTKLSLSRHFAISGFSASAGLLLGSVPFLFTNDQDTLRVCIIIARLLLDFVAYFQLYLIWYLSRLHKISIWWLALPALVLAVPSFVIQSIHFLSTFVGVVDNEVIYTFTDINKYTHLLSLLVVFFAGAFIMKNAFLQKDIRGKIRLFSIALLYMGASLSDIYSFIFLQGLSNSWIIIVGYVVATGLFLVTTVVFLPKTKNNTLT